MPYKAEVQLERLSVVVTLCAWGCAAQTPDLSQRGGPAAPSSIGPGVSFVGPRDAGAPVVNAPDPDHGQPTTSTPSGPVEPTGGRALRFLNGVVDAQHVYLCPADLTSGVILPDETPWPSAGLGFGASALLPEPQRWVEAGVAWHLVASGAPLPAGITCGDVVELAMQVPPSAGEDGGVAEDAGIASEAGALSLDAAAESSALRDAASRVEVDAAPRRLSTLLGGPAEAGATDAGAGAFSPIPADVPALRVVGFAAFSAQSLGPERSSLLVASGCIGGYPEPPQGVCGTSFGSGRSQSFPVFVHLSRITRYDVLGLQFLNASTLDLATLRSDPSAIPDSSGVYFTLATEVQLGQIAPSRLSTGVALESVGSPLSDVALVIDVPGGVEPVFTSDWQSALDRGGSGTLRNGSGWSFVLIGSPGGDGLQFNPLRLVLVPNDPAQDAEPTD